jgi:hypothetical protein
MTTPSDAGGFYHAGLAGLASEEEREFLLEQFDLVVFLVLDVPFHHVFVESCGRYKVSSSPQCSEWKLLGLLLDPCGTLSLDQLHGIGGRIFEWYGEMQMNVFVSDMPCVDGKTLPFADCLEYAFEFLFNVLVRKHGAAIFWTPDEVIIAFPCAMVQVV